MASRSRIPHWLRGARKRKAKKRPQFERRNSRIEQLEPRQMLTVDSPLSEPLVTVADPLEVQLVPVDANTSVDLLALGTAGDLTVALNRGNNTWENSQSLDLGLGSLNGLSTGLFNADLFPDLIVQGLDSLSVATGDGAGGFSVNQTIAAPTPGSFAPTAGGRVGLDVSFLNNDLVPDIVTVAPGTNEVLVFGGVGNGTLAAPTTYSSGGNEPLVAIAGDFIGNGAPDIAVGHADGSLAFLEGAGDGTFTLRNDLTIAGLGSITDLATGDFDGDGDTDLVVTGGSQAQLLFQDADPLASPAITNGNFSQGLTGWTTEIVGQQSGATPGAINAQNGFAQFTENESFLVALKQSFVVPENPQTVEFDLLALGLEDPTEGVPDAFEASLLDANQQSLVSTHRTEATSFFNMNPGDVATLASGVTFNGSKITLDISSLTPGTEATLIFDLVGNPDSNGFGGDGSVATIDNVQVTPFTVLSETFTSVPLAGPFSNATGVSQGDVDGDGFTDIVISDSGGDRVVVFNGDAAGGYARSEIDLSALGTAPTAIATGQLTTGDVADDIAVLLGNSNLVVTPLLADFDAPSPTFTSPTPGQVVTDALSEFTIQFSEPVQENGPTENNSVTNPAAYTLTGAGPDGLLGTGDDQNIPIASVIYNPATNEATVTVDPAALPLLDDTYQLTVNGSDPNLQILDTAGNPLLGGNDATLGFSLNTPPQVTSITTLVGDEGESLAFSATFVDPGFQDSRTATIDWGDGTTSAGLVTDLGGSGTVAASHTYADDGVYTATLTLTDNAGNVVTQTTSATISNLAPTVTAASNLTVLPNVPLTLNVATFSDPGFTSAQAGTTETFTATIDWGDGTAPEPATVVVTQGSEGVPTTGIVSGNHTYVLQGSYAISVTVTDDDGQAGTDTLAVTVEDGVPMVLTASDLNGDEGEAVNFSGTFADTGDPGPHTATILWGDGSSSPGVVSFTSGQGTVTGSHTYADNGQYIVTLEVTDSSNNTGSLQSIASIVGVAPVVTPASAQTLTLGNSLTLNVATFSDPGFTSAQAGTTETFTAAIDWGDGTAPEAATVVVTQGSEGVATTGIVSGNHTYAVQGSYAVSVTVTDDDGESSTGTFDVTVTPSTTGTGLWLPNIDFETNAAGNSLATGETIADQWAAWGVHVTSGNPANHPAMIFDSANPTGDDADLATANQQNVLILSEDADPSDPDDNASGGTLIFTFDQPVMLDDVDLLDIDEDGTVIVLFDAAGNEMANVAAANLGDNSQQTLALNATEVSRMEIRLAGSGAVTNVVFCRDIHAGDVVSASGAATTAEGDPYLLNLSATTDIAEWTINWGDGTAVETLQGSLNGAGHVFADGAAAANIIVTGRDSTGNVFVSEPVTVTISNIAPLLTIDGPATVEAGSTYTLNLASVDPGVDTIHRWVIDWGDGTAPQEIAGNPPTVDHVYGFGPQTYSVQAMAFDEDSPVANTPSVLEIVARGNEGDEQFHLLIDEEVVATYSVSTDFQTYTYQASDLLVARQIRIEFINDSYDPANGIDGNLIVDEIAIDGRTYETESPDVYSTGTWLPADGIQPGFRLNETLHTNGYLQYDAVRGSEVAIVARGDEGGEQLNLWIAGEVVDSFTVGTDFQTFLYSSEQDVTPDQIRIEFTNDTYDPANGIDGNLVVDEIAIDGQIYQTESPKVYSTGTWLPADSIQPGFREHETLHANGYFQFAAKSIVPYVSNTLLVEVTPSANQWLPTIDFEAASDGRPLQTGEIIAEQWATLGVHVTTHDPVNHPAMIFDSANPTGYDDDLGSTNEDFGGPGWGAGGGSGQPGENSEPLEKILIISGDGDPSDPTDDEGTIIFTFDEAVMLDEVGLIDVDEAGIVVRAYDAAGILIASQAALDLGENSVQRVVLDAVGVRRLEIDMQAESIGVTDIVFCREGHSIPVVTPATRFFVVDDSTEETFRYDLDGAPVGSFDLDYANNEPRGATTTANGTPLWVIDDNEYVYVYDTNGTTLLGEWEAEGLDDPEGIATDGNDIWIIDQDQDRVYHYANAASRLAGWQDYDSYFELDSANGKPTGITTDGTTFWISDRSDNMVYVYDVTGNLQGSWELDDDNDGASGLTINPDGGDDLWVVDRYEDAIFYYEGGASRLSGSQDATSIYALAGTNTVPRGIADPVSNINIGDVVTGELFDALQVDDYLFNGLAGQRVYTDILLGTNTTFRLAILNPDGTTLVNSSLWQDVDTIAIPVDGQYTLRVTSRSGGIGQYEFELVDVPATTVTPINLDQLVGGEIVVRGEEDHYTFNVSAGEQIFLDTITGERFDLRWRLLDPGGVQIASFSRWEDGGPFDLPTAGTHTLVVDGTGDRTGLYEFELVDVPATTVTLISLGDVVSDDISTPGVEDHYTFSGTTGQRVFIDTQGNSGGLFDVNWRLIDPTGTQIANFNRWGDGGPVDLVSNGQYTFIVDGDGDATNSYQFQLNDVTPLPPVAISLNDILSTDIPLAGEEDAFTFNVTAGQRVFVDTQVGGLFDLNWRLLDPTGTQVASDNRWEDLGPIDLLASGQYTFVVDGNGDFTGLYQAVVWNLPADVSQPIALNTPIVGTAAPTQTATFSFDGVAGEQLLLDIINNQGDRLAFSLEDPTGTTIFSGVTGDQTFAPLPNTGTYLLRFAPSGVPESTDFAFRMQQAIIPAVVGEKDSQGTEFWLAFPPATTQQNLSLYISSEEDTQVVVTIPGIEFISAIDVTGGSLAVVEIPAAAVIGNISGGGNDTIENRGVRITAQEEVTAYAVLDAQFSSDAYLGLPVDAVGTDYLILTYPTGLSFGGGQSQFTVIATEDSTTVTITPSIDAGVFGNLRPAGVPYDIFLDEGQTYRITGGSFVGFTGLTGTEVAADKPISVLAGHPIAFVPVTVGLGDHIIEQLPSTDTWGREFVTVPLATRIGGDTFRFLASVDNTTVQIDGATVATLNRGEVHEQIIEGAAEIIADQPILVAQFSNGSEFDGVTADPMMMLVTPFEQFRSEYTISTPDAGFTSHFMNLVIANEEVATVTLDGVSIAATEFLPIGTSGFSAAQVAISSGPHRLVSEAPLGVFVYGFGVNNSYGYPGGTSLAPIALATTIDATPNVANLLVGDTHVITTTLTDTAGNPLEGIRVDFGVSGVNDASGFALSDATGQVVFSYAGTIAGSDTITASVGPLTDTVTASWITAAPTINITSPAGGSDATEGTTVLVTGQALPGPSQGKIIAVLVDGVPVDALDASGKFFTTLPVALGGNTFEFTAIDQFGEEASTTFTLSGVADSGGTLDQNDLSDVTTAATLSYTNTTFNRQTRTLYADVRLTNQSSDPLAGSVLAAYSPFRPLSVDLANPDGTLTTGPFAGGQPLPFANFDTELPASGLAPGATSAAIPLEFANPSRERFSFDVALLAQGNTAPEFTSSPVTTALVGAAYTYPAIATDAEQPSLSYRLDSAPAGMTIDAISGIITWTPIAAQAGNHSLKIVADDNFGGTATQSFQVEVRTSVPNRPPQFTSPPLTQINSGEDYSYTPSVFDPDGQAPTFSLDTAPAGATINATTGEVSLLSPADGTFTLAIRADDNNGGEAVQEFSVSVGAPSANANIPRFTSSPSTEATVDSLYLYFAQAIDLDGDTVTYSLVSGPAGMTIDTASGRLDFTATIAQLGPQAVLITASDGNGGVATQSFAIEVAAVALNAAPTIDSTPLLIATQGELYTYPISATDPEGDTALTYALVSGPAGMVVHLTTGELTWTPTAAQLGPQVVELSVTDTAGATGFQNYSIDTRGLNVAPVFETSPVTTVEAGSQYRYDSLATDTEDAIVYSLVTGPFGMTVGSLNGIVFWKTDLTDTGTESVTIRATDERGLSTDQTFTITVGPDVEVPQVLVFLGGSGTSEGLINIGDTIRIDLSAYDNVAVTSLALSIDGVLQTLDSNQGVFYTATSGGLPEIVATAADASGNVGTGTAELRVLDPSDTTAPFVEITSPSPLNTLSYLTDIIGTVTDNNLEFYRLELSPIGENQWRTITEINMLSGGGNVINDTLGNLDPTLLSNSIYDIRLYAQDTNGLVSTDQISVAVESMDEIGTFETSSVDLIIPVAGGLPISIVRHYDTSQADSAGDFGHGWEYCLSDPRIVESVPRGDFENLVGQFGATALSDGDKVYITTPDCQRVGFTFAPQPHVGIWSSVSDQFYDPIWIADAGVDYELFGENDFTTLTGLASGDFDVNGLSLPLRRLNDGSYVIAQLGASYNPLGYQLIGKDQTRFHYNQYTGLEDVTDRNGNTMTFNENGIISSSGQQVQFMRDEQGRIIKVIDPVGNEIDYTYNTAGDLIKVDYPNGQSDTYEYDAGPEHYLSAINNANEEQATSPTAHVEYDIIGRLSQIIDGLGNINRQEYDIENNTQTIFDALGNPYLQQFDDRGNVIREVDPAGDEALYTYDDDGNLTAITDERGFVTQFTYDDRRNTTSVTDPLGNVTLMTYNERNDFVTQSDSLGNQWEYFYDNNGNLIQITGPQGIDIGFTHDARGRVITVRDSLNNVRTMEYGEGPHPTRIINPDGTFQEVTYNQWQKQTSITDENGNTTQFEYDNSARITKIIDPLAQETLISYRGRFLDKITNKRGFDTQYLYDSAGRLLRITDTQNGLWFFGYDAVGQKINEQDPLGRETTFSYTTDYLLETMTDAQGQVTQFEYDEVSNQTAITDANGHRSDLTYDANNLLLTSSDALGNTWNYAYDEIGNLISVADPNSHATLHEYDNLHRLVRTEDSLQGVTTFAYDLRTNLTGVTDQNGNTTVFAYDALDRLISETDALGGVRQYAYDGIGNRTSQVDERGNATVSGYDELDRLVSIQDASGAVQLFEYNPSDLISKSTDALGAEYAYAYDSLDRLISMTDPAGGIMEYTYDAIGNQLSVSDQLDRVTNFTYDVLNRQIRVTDPRGGISEWAYDPVGNLLSVTDSILNVTQHVYDDADRLIEAIDPLGNSTTMSYDAAGNLLQTVDRNDRIRNYTYDELDRRATETWLDTVGTTVNTLQFAYDPVGNLTSASDIYSQYAFTYDDLDRQLTSDNGGTPGLPNVVLTSTFDAVSNRTLIADNTGVTVSSVYDERNLLSSRNWSGGGIDPARLDYLYNQNGDRTQIDRFADLAGLNRIGRTTFGYDAKRLTTDISHTDSVDSVLADYDYVRDLANQLTQETHHGQTSDYSLDQSGQLTSATHSSQTDENYSYDANGNRTNAGLTVGPNNQILSNGTFDYTYDLEGNLTRKTEIATGEYTELSYDHRNRLVEGVIFSAGGVILREVDYTYDLFDRNIARTVDNDGAGPGNAETRYTVYDGEHAWADFDTSGNVLARYLFGDRTDEILARWRPSEGTAWYLTDHLGTVRDIADATGILINTITYDSFGNIVSQTNASAGDRFTFTGREWDSALGLYYYRARFYDPGLGRFVSQDPLGFAAGDANLYRYVGNSPLTATDPSGNLALTECAIVRGLDAAVSVGCSIAEGWADGTIANKDPSARAEFALRLISDVSSVLPGGAGLAMQLTMQALMAKTAMDVTAPFLGPFAGVGMQVYGVYDAWRDAKDKGGQYNKIFLVKTICTTLNLGMMVWSARARCFVAGTPVVIDFAPTKPLLMVQANVEPGEGLTVLDAIGGVALVVGLTAHVSQKNKSKRQPLLAIPSGDTRDNEPDDESDSMSFEDLIDEVMAELPAVSTKRQSLSNQTEAPSQRSNEGQSPHVPEGLAIHRKKCLQTASASEGVSACSKSRTWSLLSSLTLLVTAIFLAPRLAQTWTATESTASAASVSAVELETPQFLMKPIEELRPGDRVLAHNPEVTDLERASAVEPTPETWRLIEMEVTGEDGHRVEVRLLRPVDWVEQHGAVAGGSVPIDLEELGVSGMAGVLNVSPCPEIKPGNGQIVTGAFRHIAENLVQVHVEGETEPLVCTSRHPFWSEDRQTFVDAATLKPGERLRTADDQVTTVVRVANGPATALVFNVEVDVEHVYYVGEAGTLVHNAASCSTLSKPLRSKFKKIKSMTRQGGDRSVTGRVSKPEAQQLAESFVGPGFRTTSDAKGNRILISSDGLKQARGPSFKPPHSNADPRSGQPYSNTGFVINFETRNLATGAFNASNVHLDVEL